MSHTGSIRVTDSMQWPLKQSLVMFSYLLVLQATSRPLHDVLRFGQPKRALHGRDFLPATPPTEKRPAVSRKRNRARVNRLRRCHDTYTSVFSSQPLSLSKQFPCKRFVFLNQLIGGCRVRNERAAITKRRSDALSQLKVSWYCLSTSRGPVGVRRWHSVIRWAKRLVNARTRSAVLRATGFRTD